MPTPKEALHRIGACKKARSETLDLRYCGLVEIPKEITDLIWLKQLFLSANQIGKIEGLGNLKALTELHLYANDIGKIEGLDNLNILTKLDLSENNISKIEGLDNLNILTKLDLSANNISKIEGLDNLKALSIFNLSSNRISKIEGLDNLKALAELSLSSNQISKIKGLNNLIILTGLSLSSNQISKIEGLDNLNALSELYLSSNRISKIEGLDNLNALTKLNLNSNQISKIEGLDNLNALSELYLSSNQISKIEGLKQLTSLIRLDLSENSISKIEGLEQLTSLLVLYLSSNHISKIEGLDSLTSLSVLYLSFNQISKIEGFNQLTSLYELDLAENRISKIEGFEKLTALSTLNLYENQIKKIDADNLDKILQDLEEINLFNNPIEDVPESFLDDVQALLGYFESKKDQQVPNCHLKVNILGEGRIGKTQLFHFFEKQKYVPRQNETHGTNTAEYEFKEKYKAKIWDFGGQSYHHGFHQLFIRPRDFNVVLWTTKNSSYGYWLGVARNYSPESSLYLVQNVWTETDYNNEKATFEPHSTVYPDSRKLQTYQVGLASVFAINIKELFNKTSLWKTRHTYFLNSLEQAMAEHISKEKTFAQVSQKWLTVKKELDTSPFEDIYLSKQEFKDRFAKDFDENTYEALLLYLEFAGNLLYFKGKPYLENYIFPDPPRLSAWIYDKILDKAFKENQEGILDVNKLEKKIGQKEAVFFREIMNAFELIFEEKGNSNHLVIPQFLPEQNNTFKRYLLDLIPYSFCLRFEDFIHEARIFQFIREYGEYAHDNTSYWRYGILFTKSEVRTLVFYDQPKRIINVHIEDVKGRTELAKEIFDYFIRKERKMGRTVIDYVSILELGNKAVGKVFPFDTGISEMFDDKDADKKLLRESPKVEEVIEGTQLSTNQHNYFDIKETLQFNTDGLNIGICVDTRQKIKLDYLAINLLGMENHKLPKVFISYNRKDLEFKEELRTHLSILERYDLLKAWSCDEIRAGKWDKQIQTELEEADIIIYMISHHFMASEYIMEKEIKKGIQLAEANPGKKIMCVVVRECAWRHWTVLEEKFKEIKGYKDKFVESMDLTQYQFLPYHRYLNQEGVATREEIVAMERWGRTIYDVRNVAFEQIVSKIIKEVK